MEQVRQFGESISRHLEIEIKNNILFFEAFSHPSFIHENEVVGKSYQRLEFLGDAALDLIISDLLLEEFQDWDEGELSKLRAQIVNEKSLAEISRSIDLGEYVFLGNGEIQNNGRNNDSILSDIFESLVGAIYIDSGIELAKEFVLKTLNYYLDQKGISLLELSFDYKSKLQEKIMKEFKSIPVYEAKELNEGFEVRLLVNNKIIDTKWSTSKKKAQLLIAENVYKHNKLLNTLRS